jgi:hypothetical protein
LNIYWFKRTETSDFKKLSKTLENAGFDGILFPWSSMGDDYFTNIANSIDSKTKIKYMVAIRPYAVSPQYLCKVNRSMNKISPNRILINFVTGWIYDEEKSVGGITEDINDLSSSVERSNYMINYIKTLNTIKNDLPTFYISTTNKFVFEAAKDNKVIIPYSWYKIKIFDLVPQNSMIHVAPIIRKNQNELDILNKENFPQDTEFFTENEFKKFILELREKNFDGVLISNSLDNVETKNIIKVVQEIQE